MNNTLITNKESPVLELKNSEDEDSIPSWVISTTIEHLENDIIQSDESNILINSDDYSTDHQVTFNFAKSIRSLYAKREKTMITMRRITRLKECMKLPSK